MWKVELRANILWRVANGKKVWGGNYQASEEEAIDIEVGCSELATQIFQLTKQFK